MISWISGVFCSIIGGFFVYDFGSAPEVKKPNNLDQLVGVRTTLRWTIWYSEEKVLVLHIHHWLYLLGLMCAIDNIYFHGFCIGGIIQGLTYKDRWKILYWEPIDITQKLHT